MARRIIIPARFASSRLPQKLLLPICGKPVIQHVYEQAMRCGFDSVLIATDDERIARVATGFGAEVVMTKVEHPSGTDRLAEAFNKMHYHPEDIIVNIQGDEPLIPVENVIAVADNLARFPASKVATLCEPLHDIKEIMNPNIVKVVMDKEGMALYFSRAAIPWARGHFPESLPKELKIYRHIGIYAYRGAFLSRYVSLGVSPIETIESLEQLRILWHGEKIHVGVAKEHTLPGIDTHEDLIRTRQFLGDATV